MGCVPVLAACATTFGAPLRHAVANLQATSVDVGTDLRIDGLIVALPSGSTADKGEVAYIQFNVVNSASQPDELLTASAKATGSTPPAASSNGTTASSAAASGAPAELSDNTLPVGSTTVPAATAQSPGAARMSVALTSLTQPIAQGESVLVSLQFKNGGAIDDVLVPVQGSKNVGSSFLPSAPPSIPASETPLPASSAPASSAPASPTSSS